MYVKSEDELCKEIRVYLETDELNEKYENKRPEWAKEIEYFEVPCYENNWKTVVMQTERI